MLLPRANSRPLRLERLLPLRGTREARPYLPAIRLPWRFPTYLARPRLPVAPVRLLAYDVPKDPEVYVDPLLTACMVAANGLGDPASAKEIAAVLKAKGPKDDPRIAQCAKLFLSPPK